MSPEQRPAEQASSDGDAKDGDSAGTATRDVTPASEGPDEDQETADVVREVVETSSGAWLGVAAAAFVGVALGVALRSPGLILLGGLGTVLVAYERVAAPPASSVAVEREFDPADPGVGEPVTVTVTVRNVGERTLPDVRVADGVPSSLRVVDGPARTGATLRPGESTTLTYEVAGGSGRHLFERAAVRVRDVTGVVERRTRVGAEPASLTWETPPGESLLPVRPDRAQRPGRVATQDAGQGLAFHSVREHRRGDPMSRVDWHRLARTGEFATVEYQRERAATIVALVDTRTAAALAPADNAPTAIERSVTATAALVERLPEAGHAVGIAAVSSRDCWLPPGHGPTQQERARALLGEHQAFRPGGTGREWDTGVDAVLERLPGNAHVVFLSPVPDDEAVAIARQLQAREFDVTVVSPDPTAADNPGHRLARAERRERLATLRASGIPTHDWPADESFEHVVARARWSQ